MSLAARVDALERQHSVAMRLLRESGWMPFGYHVDPDPAYKVELEFYGEDLSADGLPVFERIAK